jgi:hypothetical protein
MCATGAVCVNGSCIKTSCVGIECATGTLCVAGVCAPTSCATIPCPPGYACPQGTCVDPSCLGLQCPAGEPRCYQGACFPGSCSDGIQNGPETDVDCGGGICPACPVGKHCLTSNDCVSLLCTKNVCVAPPSCTDGIKDGNETDIDCGGPDCPACGFGKDCLGDSDCKSKICTQGKCGPAQGCSDGIQDGDETDVDCGGSCPPCGNGKHCKVNGDCSSVDCVNGVCSPPSCTDGIKNGNETDIDCGGGTCPPCGTGKTCIVAGDCASKVCTLGVCAAPSCTDGVLNGTETDVDCGGGTCPGCALGKKCAVGSDCSSKLCTLGVCTAPPLFGLAAIYTAGSVPVDLVVGDVDGDGKLDLVVLNNKSSDVNIFWGNGDGTFTAAPSIAAYGGGAGNSGPVGIALGDINGDGIVDIVNAAYGIGGLYGSPGGCDLSVLAGAGSRSFKPAVNYPEPTGTNSKGCGARIVTGKFVGSTLDDVVVGQNPYWDGFGGENSTGGLFWPASLSTGFGAPVRLAASGQYVAAADVNRDGFLDVVSHYAATTSVNVFLGNGSGGFTAETTTITVTAGEGDICTGNFNADSYPDIAVSGHTSNRVNVALNSGNGTFLAPTTYAVTNPDGIAAADVNGDGKIDLVVGGIGLDVLLGNGDGTFQADQNFGTALLPDGGTITVDDTGKCVAGDFNGDTKPDVACISVPPYNANAKLWVWLNTSP